MHRDVVLFILIHMITLTNEYRTSLIIIAKLMLEGVIDQEYNNLSQQEKRFVNSYVSSEKERQKQLNNEFNNIANDNKFYVC